MWSVCVPAILLTWLFYPGIVHLRLPHLALLNLDATMVTEETVTSLPGCPQLQKITAKNLLPPTQDDE